MSKNLRLTDKEIEKYLNEVRKELKKGIAYNGSIKLPEIKETKQSTNLYIDPEVYVKIRYIVEKNAKEVGWHGTAERVEDGYRITGIMLYPQVVTGSTVDTDQVKYTEWLQNLDDTTANALRFHGHSHVSMGVTPSSTDESHRKEIISKIGQDGFYIFMIFNKAGDISARIYDAVRNTVYETSDINVITFTGKAELDKQIEEFVKEKQYAQAKSSEYQTAPKANKPQSKKKPAKKEEVVRNISFDDWVDERAAELDNRLLENYGGIGAHYDRSYDPYVPYQTPEWITKAMNYDY